MRDDFGFDGPRRPLVWRILLWPFTFVGSFLGKYFASDDIQGSGGAAGLAKRILLAPFNWTWSAGTALLLNWSSSRSFRSFLIGLPAFMFALVIIAVVIFGSLNRDAVVDRYKLMFREAKEMASRELKVEEQDKPNSETDPSAPASQSEENKTAVTTTDENGKKSRSQGYFEQAELLLNRLIRLVPAERDDNQLKKAELLIDQKKYGDAANILTQLVRPGEAGSPKAHLLLGQYYLTDEFRKAQGFEKLTAPEQLKFNLQSQLLAEQHLEQVLLSAQTEHKRGAHFLLYRLYTQRRLFELASRSLEFLAAEEPGLAAEHYRFFTTVLNLPQTAEAMADRNHQFLREKLAKEPDNLQVWQLRIQLYLLQKKFDEALNALAQGLDSGARTESKVVFQQFMSEVLLEKALNLGEASVEKTTRPQRLTLLSEAVRIFPGNRRAVEQLVVLGFPLDKDESDQWLYEAKASAPAGSPVFYGVNMVLGLRAVFEGDNQTAKTYLDAAAGMGPGFSTVLQALTLAIDPNAKAMLEGTTDASATDLPTAPALFGIYMILGSRSVLEKKYERGLDFFKKALEANPKSVTAQNNYAYCLINKPGASRTEFEQALILASEIVAIAPQIPNFYETRGAIYLKLEDYNLAIADFERALQLKFPNPSMIHRNLVIACRAAGRNAEADAYQKMVDQAEQTSGGASPTALPATEVSQPTGPPAATPPAATPPAATLPDTTAPAPKE
jgi:tetratricopeptide (TPR) repeat protein